MQAGRIAFSMFTVFVAADAHAGTPPEPTFTVVEQAHDGHGVHDVSEHRYFPEAPSFRLSVPVADWTCIADLVTVRDGRPIDAEWQCSADGARWTSVSASPGERAIMVLSRLQGGNTYVLTVDWR